MDDNLSSNQQSDLITNGKIIVPCCLFRCKTNSHPFDERCIPLNEQIKIGRAVARLKPLLNNAIFDCKVLSRQHAKLWYENGKFLLQDTKSSNGTFVNNERIGKCNEESEPYEIYSGDIIQFGVDVTENNRKTVHNCIIMEVKLYHANTIEASSRSFHGQSLISTKEFDINSQILYQLAQYLQEAMHREQMLEQKLEYLQNVIGNIEKASNDSWHAIICEDRLLDRINALEDQIRIYRSKSNSETLKQDFIKLTEIHKKFQEELKTKLTKIFIECANANSRSESLENSLNLTQNELKNFQNQNQEYKQEIQKFVKSIDEHRRLISEFQTKLEDCQTRFTELENEKLRIENQFKDYFQRINPLEEKIANEIELNKAKKQILELRENINETTERLVSTEDSCRIEEERFHLLKSKYELINDELKQLKNRLNIEKIENKQLVEQQTNEIHHLSKSILLKHNEHDELLRVYMYFLLLCYLLIFFLIFYLLPW